MSLHRNILRNGEILAAATPAFFAGQLGLLAGWGIFSTLRVSEGALFAWDRHWARMSRDSRLLNVPMPPDAAAVENSLLKLVEANSHPDCTLRLVIVRNTGGMWAGPHGGDGEIDVIALTADSKDWGDGVRLGVQPNARFAAGEFAGVKTISWAANLTWAERAQQRELDEVILLNERGMVAECTSANIFAVFRTEAGYEAATPPLTDGCLAGITREVLLQAVQEDGIRVIERSLTIADLARAEEVFITSTTRDLLPVVEIDGHPANRRSDTRERLSLAFGKFLASDIASRRPAAVAV